MNYLEQRLALKLNGKPKEEKVIKPIAKRSGKRIKEQRDYVKIVKEMMAISDRCELKVIGVCQGKATGLHHLKKRAGFLTDKRYLKRACNACNLFCETNPLEALKIGISLSKFS